MDQKQLNLDYSARIDGNLSNYDAEAEVRDIKRIWESLGMRERPAIENLTKMILVQS